MDEHIVGDWTNPSEKIWVKLDHFPKWKLKNIWNHHLDHFWGKLAQSLFAPSRIKDIRIFTNKKNIYKKPLWDSVNRLTSKNPPKKLWDSNPSDTMWRLGLDDYPLLMESMGFQWGYPRNYMELTYSTSGKSSKFSSSIYGICEFPGGYPKIGANIPSTIDPIISKNRCRKEKGRKREVDRLVPWRGNLYTTHLKTNMSH